MVEHIREHPFNALWVDMGLGKTVSALTATQSLIEDFDVNKTLVIAPLRVARKTWTDEIEEWAHLKGLSVSKCLGTAKKRIDGANADADIYLINRENVDWLVQLHLEHKNKKWYLRHKWKWDNVILDESSSFKSQESNRFKALARMRKYMQRMTQLTGTPSPNGLMDIWSQMWLLDKGAALGHGIGDYRRRWWDPPSYMEGKYQLKAGAEKQIHDALGSRILTLRAEDYLDLPPVVSNYIPVEMTRAQHAQYEKFQKDFTTELQGKKITAVNAGVLAGKLLQAANGAVYTQHPAWEKFHDAKIEALRDIVDTTEAPRLIFYNFKSDLERIEKLFKADKIPYRVLKSEQDEKDWDDGKIDNLLLHPASAGHGLNMHKSGSELIIWFGLNWSLELYMQANARLIGGHRRIGKNVVLHHIFTQGTIDEDVIAALMDKNATQERLLNAMKRMIRSII